MFGDRKNGRAAISYPHPLLEEVLKETYGIFVYQEQVMEAAKILAGYSLGEADLLRRAMGKKIKTEMDAQRAGFVEGCARVNGIPAGKANELFDLIDKFAGYGFNKSHAAAYALVAYQTAWLKAHHRHEFFAASMAFDIHQTDKLAIFADDMRRLDVTCLPPAINASEADFSVEEQEDGLAVRYALGALKGVGEKAMAQLVAEREANGPFRSLDDFAGRIDPRLLNRRQIESLAGAGAFDGIAERWAVHAAAETILAAASSAAEARVSGQGGLFGEGPANVAPIRMPRAEPWTLAQRMAAEKESFGFYFSAHPVDNYRHLVDAHGGKTFAQLAAMPAPADGGRVGATMAALVESTRWRTSARGRRYMLAMLSDPSGQFEASIFDDQVAEQVAAAAKAGTCALLTIEADRRPGEETPRVAIRALQSLDSLAGRARLQLEIEIDEPAALGRLAAAVAGDHGGSGQLRLKAAFEGGEADDRARPHLPDRRRARRPDRADRRDRLGQALRRRRTAPRARFLSAHSTGLLRRAGSDNLSPRTRGEGAMLGGMQDYELRVPRIIEHAEREHGQREIVTYWADGTITRTNWAGIARDARKLAQALEKMGVKRGDRIATLGHEPQPPPRRLVWRDRRRRGHPHGQPAPVRRAARLHRQPCRGQSPVLRQGLRSRSSSG